MKGCIEMEKMKKSGAVITVLSMMIILAVSASCGNVSPSTEQGDSGQANGESVGVDGVVVFVNGVEVPGAFPMSINLEQPYAPTHVVLMEILAVLEAPVNVADGVVTVQGLRGTIIFEIGSEDFDVGGEVVTLANLPSFVDDGTIYVPIRFFRDVFGMNNAYFSGGTVQINNDERME